MRVHAEPRFLISESISTLIQFVRTHPVSGSLLLVASFLVVVVSLKRVFGRIAGDVLFFALIVWTIVLIFGSSLFSLFYVKGFHF